MSLAVRNYKILVPSDIYDVNVAMRMPQKVILNSSKLLAEVLHSYYSIPSLVKKNERLRGNKFSSLNLD